MKAIQNRCVIILVTLITSLSVSAALGNELPDSVSASTTVHTAVKSANALIQSNELRNFNISDEEIFNIEEVTSTSNNTSNTINTLPISYHEQRAKALLERVKTENRFVKFLDSTALVDLPIGIVSAAGKDDYAILIDSLVITPTHAYLTVYMCISIPQSDKKLVFRGDNIRLSKSAGITGDARMFLVNDVKDIEILGSKSTMTILGGPNNTNALWDCNGFKEINLSADITFSKEWLIPVEGTNPVMSHFQTTIRDWNDMVVSINLAPFKLSSLPNTEFHTKNVVFDFSDYVTPESIQFPTDYNSSKFINGDKRLWRGFYMEEITVLMPPEFKQKNSNNRISFSGYKLLIDNMGFSGDLEVKNLIDIGSGDMDGWGYSLDSLAISIESNQLRAAGFKGNINIPIGDHRKPFGYNAIINTNGNYLFNVSTLDQLTFEAWQAQLIIENGSYLEVTTVNGNFKPKAVLNGSMDVKVPSSEVSLLGITFEELAITTTAPYLDAKAFSLGSEKLENSVKSFPVSINNIGFNKKDDNNLALNFNLKIHLTGDNDGSFYGDAGLELNAIRNQVNQKWEYDGVELTSVAIDINGGSFTLKGMIKLFEDDQIYGKGYNGTVEMTFQPGFLLSGTVIFGKIDGYRYWYADAFAGFPTGIPFCGPLALYGFGGGMYHNMEQVGFSQDAALSNGKSLSGVIYKPNREIKYGFKATVQVGLMSSKETFNGDATFEMSFNQSGGIRRVSLLGNGYVLMDQQLGDYQEMAALVETMTESESAYGENTDGDIHYTSGLRPEGKDAMISGHFFQYYDFANKELHGEIEIYVDVFGALKGVGPNGLAGWSVMHFSPEEWFMYIGTPDRRIGLKILGLLTMDGYLMVGDQIPGSPPPPARVGNILGENFDYMRDENALGTGKGLAFGASMSFDTGRKRFLMFYGQFAMGMGFDIMLKNYGDQVSCKGRSSTLGINGWYANGQAYAYAEGSIGIRVRIFFKKKNIEILKLSAAVVMQTKLPNPFWMKGTVGGRYSVLGGLVKGSCKFSIEIGDECQIENASVLEGLNVIADITPQSGKRDESVFVSPQAVFNLEIGKHFRMTDFDEEEKTFRIILDHFHLKNQDKVYTANLSWNDDNTVAVFDNMEVLAPNTEFVAQVQVSFEEFENGKWSKVLINGKAVTEVSESNFTTGPAPDYIPHQNIAYSYPQINQFNFYPNEYPDSYIKLKKGQAYLFENNENWHQEIRLITSSGDTSKTTCTYINNEIGYKIPNNLKLNSVYEVQVVSVPHKKSASLDGNITSLERDVEIAGVKTDTKITTKKATGSLEALQESLIFNSTFRTSNYKSFTAKLEAMNISEGWRLPDSRGQSLHILGNNISANEFFDQSELYGINNNPALVHIEANLADNNYYNNYVHPLVYKDYPSLTVPEARIQRRDNLGIPPTKAVYINQEPRVPVTLSSSAFQNGASSPIRSANFIYELPYYMKVDYRDLQSQTAHYCVYRNGTYTQRRLAILEKSFPIVLKGNYQLDMTYTLPGINKITTRKTFFIINPLK